MTALISIARMLFIMSLAYFMLGMFQGYIATFFFWMGQLASIVDYPFYMIDKLFVPVSPLVKTMWFSIPLLMLFKFIVKFVRGQEN